MKSFRFLLFILCFYLPASAVFASDWQFSGVDRMVAVGDIHGAYGALVSTLQQAEVIDQDRVWSGTDTHLVFTGDLLDRGPESRKVMDLVMRLEQEAVEAGGRVHLLLGNHEVMNLVGDLRYVSDLEFAAFSEDESPGEREDWYRQYRNSQAENIDELSVRAEFDQKAPPGFFGHRHAFSDTGRYGKWLLEKPLMIVINDTAFVHGGAPPYVSEHGLDGVNGQLKADLLGYVTTLSVVEEAGLLSPVEQYRERTSILTEIVEAGQVEPELLLSAQALIDFRSSPLQSAAGPTWYRGTATCGSLVEGDVLDAALNRIGAKRVVMGHTTTGTRRIQQRMGGQVIEIDTGMLKASYNGSGNALIIEDELITVVNQDGAAGLSPVAHPMHIGSKSTAIDDDVLAGILSSGTIVDAKFNGTAWHLLQLEADGQTVYAYFDTLPRKNGFSPELAAFRLDRLLGLNRVPVTVRREIEGQLGTLQHVPADMLSERERVTGEKGERAPCGIEKQRGAMYVFDALIHNPARTPQSMLYSQDNWQLVLIDHAQSFSTAHEWPAYLENSRFSVGGQWLEVLQTLDDEKLRNSLGDVLDEKRLEALSRRRDSLIRGNR